MEKAADIIAHLFGVSAIRYFLLAGIPFLLCYLLFFRKLTRFKIQERLAGKKDYIREIWHSMQTTLVLSLIGFAVLFTPLRSYTQVYRDINAFPLWYIPVSVVLALVIHDTYFYWMHRTLHHPALFKRTHLLHHRSTNPSPWASYSFHLLEAVAEGFVLVIIAMVIPIHGIAVMWFTTVAFLINVYGHLGYEIAPKWLRHTVLFQIINTSVHHNLHHSRFRGNYGLYFRVWDRVMGTEHPDYVKEYDRLQEQRFGRKATGLKKQIPPSPAGEGG
ncbi:sterol desaturase family protein [Chitinophaga sp. XS-30]|uniref:sterol desaturase family protein n=1 Tax=Chitinophaga sp. XS-30 TaxID=2604421 RepID=UPI0011DC9AB2|nr:sterol desaturase family protein [Chitinophaga sp. XS-30]QEH39587.1 sterol desaturase family protein [Chitinophaga sp. XS-30]